MLGNQLLIGDRVSAAQPGRGLLAPRVTAAAGHQANIVLRLLKGWRLRSTSDTPRQDAVGVAGPVADDLDPHHQR